ncbi:MAG TPA: carbohydrate porin, partial [Stellaceae bacterium]|nr:carbohydrate porin [Stellaceae bacterium]
AVPAYADNPPPENPATGNNSPEAQVQGKKGEENNDKKLLGDIGGLRPAIATYGFDFKASETDEILGNISGGLRRGAIYDGLTDISLKFDLRKYFDWRGVFYARAFQIHGRGLSANYLDNLITASSIEADRSTRLSELWYEQHIGDWLRIRVGQQGADQEFLVSTTAKLFVNSTFGWPTLEGIVLPSGGPAYPLSTPALRFRIDASDALTFFAAAFNGNPAGPGPGDPQLRDASGTAFRTGDGVLAFFEARYNPENSTKNGTYRLGAWFNSERFADRHVDSNGVSLASPLSTGTPRLLGNDYSLYAIVDQPLFPDKDSDNGFSAFVRAMGAPGDRNLVDFYFDTGLVYKGPFGRDDDAVGIGYGYARIGNAARLLDQDTAGAAAYPTRSRETALEISYQYQATPWWQLQPDFQYVTNPGGGILNPTVLGQKVGNAAIFGLRTAITF